MSTVVLTTFLQLGPVFWLELILELTCVYDCGGHMIMQILANSWKIDNWLYVDALEVRHISDTRDLKQLGCVKCTSSNYSFFGDADNLPCCV